MQYRILNLEAQSGLIGPSSEEERNLLVGTQQCDVMLLAIRFLPDPVLQPQVLRYNVHCSLVFDGMSCQHPVNHHPPDHQPHNH